MCGVPSCLFTTHPRCALPGGQEASAVQAELQTVRSELEALQTQLDDTARQLAIVRADGVQASSSLQGTVSSGCTNHTVVGHVIILGGVITM